MSFRARISQIHRAVLLVWRATPGWTLVNLVLVVCQGILPLTALYLMKRIVDTVATGVTATDKAGAAHQLLVWLLLAGGVALLTTLFRFLAELAGEAQSQLVTDAITDILHTQSAAVDQAYYEDPRYHNTLHRAQQEAPFRPTQIVNSLVQIGQSSIAVLGIAGLLCAYNWRIALMLVLLAIPGALVRLLHARRSYNLQRRQTEDERLAAYYHWLLAEGTYAKEVRLFDLGGLLRERFRALRGRLRTAKLALTRRRVLMDTFVQGIAALAIFAMLGFAAHEALRGAITLGAMVMYYQGLQTGLSSLQSVLRGMAGLYEHSLFLSNYEAFLALRPSVVALPPVHAVPRAMREGIRFQGVSFRYAEDTPFVLKDIDLEIAPGQVIALVGDNGSGKTTLTKLLCRLYDPTQGSVLVDGIDLRHMDPAEWRHQISAVFQDYVRYLLTARDNIWLGDIERQPDDDAVVEAARKSGADAVIRQLPEGYDTLLGRTFQGGVELSIGQWQKVAVARAFLRDAQLIMLDEPSSALDPLAETELFRRFRAHIRGRSAVLISHRFSTVQMADYIYVLEAGRIVEHGTHLDLLHTGGKYARLYLSQAEHYQGVPVGVPTARPA